MRKVALILDGIVAKKFLDLVIGRYFNNNNYIVISSDPIIVSSNMPNHFICYNLDPTSEYKVNQCLGSNVMDAFVVMDDLSHRRVVYEILRRSWKEMRIILNIKSSEEEEFFREDKTVLVNETSLISVSFSSHLPNTPMIPQDFGLGRGEIMQISIPVGSVFAYRHIGSIQQKNYRIVGIYRQNDFFLGNYSMVIQPADTILVAGNPQVLENVYRQIKNEIGQFPAPFGRDLHVYVDMILQTREEIVRDITQALFLHKNLKNAKLFIIVLRPTEIEVIEEIKSLDQGDINVVFNYNHWDFKIQLQEDVKKRIGMVILGRELFSLRSVRKALFAAGVPVFKTSSRDISELCESVVVLNQEMNEHENISSVIFDISIQMNLSILVYDFDPDSHYQEDVTKVYQNLSALLNKEIHIKQTHIKNPVLFLRELKKCCLHFLPFERCITGRKMLNYFSTKVEKISFMLDHHPQIFIPILEKLDDR